MGWANLLISSLRLMDSRGYSADIWSIIVDRRGYVANLWNNTTVLWTGGASSLISGLRFH
jgi:hypothetical protein